MRCTLLLTLISLLITYATASIPSPAECRACIPNKIRKKPAIGFNLGQSYGTAVAYYDNGTSINLAKILATDTYKTLLSDLTIIPNSQQSSILCALTPNCHPNFLHARHLIRAARVALGLPSTDLAAEITNMLSELKSASEAALNIKISDVGISAPCQDSPWDEPEYMKSVIAEAMYENGLSAGPDESDMIFMGDAEAVLLSEGKNMCCSYGCNGSGKDNSYTDHHRDPGIYYISITNSSLYTRFIPNHCSHAPCVETRSTIIPIDNFPERPPASFWVGLVSAIVEQASSLDGYRSNSQHIATMVVAGEASHKRGFECAVKRAARRLERGNHPPQWSTFNERGDQIITIPAPTEIEVVFAKDREFAAAKGAAVWARMRMEEGHYCRTLACCPDGLLIDGPDTLLMDAVVGETYGGEPEEKFGDGQEERCDWLEEYYDGDIDLC